MIEKEDTSTRIKLLWTDLLTYLIDNDAKKNLMYARPQDEKIYKVEIGISISITVGNHGKVRV